MPSTSRSRGSGRGPDGASRAQVIAPMSERQQLALVMQISSQDAPPAAPTPAEERKRTRQQRNERGETPLHVAAIRGDHDQVKKLLDQGQDPDMPDFAGWTPLHEACSYGWYQVVVVLVNGGANVNAKGLDDDTPLHDATTSGNLKMVKFLIEHGADPFVKNTKGKMPSDYAAPHIYEYLQSLKDNNVRAAHVGRARDDSVKKGCNASANSECSKRNNMETLAQGENFDGKDAVSQEKGSTESRDESTQLSSNVVSSTQDETVGGNKRQYAEDNHEAETADEEGSKRKKKKENEEKEPMGRPLLVGQRGPGRKPPGPASKTGASQLGKSGGGQNAKGSGGSGKGNAQSQGKGGSGGKANAQSSHQSKSSGSKGSGSQGGKQDRKSPVASPKPNLGKDSEGDSEEQKSQESSGPKVPPLKIVIPGGGAASRSEQEGEGTRGSGKGRGNMSTLPYVIPCTSNDTGQTSDSSDGNSDDKRPSEGGKAGQRVLRSHRTNDGDKDKDKERTSPQSGSDSRSAQNQLNSNKSPQPSSSVSNISILL
ncbi:hypothetical protein O3G_MSEX010595 [Manduca sexta]|uniref:Uncharacterized protein n=1 Tax=Manduca sexta TaxID=7130 RepID=A0A921ZJV3_MANSE|nr:hypothetical protein O3G_MSEX010595 [Manduca sexta]